MEFFVTLANSTVVDIVVHPKGKGQDCMDKICNVLGIIEQDYFGLLYKGSKGENLWLNLRNRLDRQLFGQPPYRLQFRIKFFVEPHNLLTPSSRQQFYEQVKSELESQKLTIESGEHVKELVALISQVEYGKFDRRTNQMNLYKSLLTSIAKHVEPTPELVDSIIECHKDLGDLSKDSALTQVLQLAEEMPKYGTEFYEATSADSDVNHVGISPSGVCLLNSNMNLIERILYPMILKAEHHGRVVVLKVVNDNGTFRDLEFRLISHPSANSMYRCITEMHSFFFCDTVQPEVSTQFCRDFKGTLASLFNEKTKLGLDYVFDIKRTLREALDHTRRVMFKANLNTPSGDACPSPERENSDCEFKQLNVEKRCQVLEETIERISETYRCCVCRDNELSAVLIPCGHPTCLDCGKQLSLCPLCRAKIENVQQLFLPAINCRGATGTSSISLKTGNNTSKHRHCHKRKREADIDNTELTPQ
ncbi:E3 ubiquitin-protein ligase MYLIP-like [Dreissena polymorpha]|uniref:RING-type E3 ubiquitin transferase n=1 Tax=Dreissena polymorpha TaxID=45954 RepID=A0A9D4E816_DREPO|nr:E3 ubiquitin-protein ligase MYLIP-like [Dreissena polymorpha]KAH3773999.1 hypothetical protein DPMN_175370 [Dreissena polymorpha]